MHVNVSCEGRRLFFEAVPSDQDVKFYASLKGKLGERKVFVDLEFDAAQGIHPDLVALAALLIVEPFTSSEITLNFAVSSGFQAVFERLFRKRLGPIDPSLDQREFPCYGREALAFSGGVDSCAALALLPNDTVSFFLKRTDPAGEGTGRYNSSAALSSCAAVERVGYKVLVVPSSLEYVRDPVGFPVDWSNAVPAILHADRYALRSVNFGMIAESAYRLGSPIFSDLAKRKGYKTWFAIFEYAGVPISLPTAGLSEVLTTALSHQQPSSDFMPQSCVRGLPGAPCGVCFKCFRKTILDAAVRGVAVPDSHFDVFLSSKEVRRKITAVPMHHEIVMAFAIDRILPSSHPIYLLLKDRVRPICEYGIDFLFKYNPVALNLVPVHVRWLVLARISQQFDSMSVDDVISVFNWSMDGFVEDSRYKTACDELRRIALSC